ncbi:GNAT family N-acetyltransferase [Sphingomonas endolithica]|uniref:GNAT family N-acetyltransferase n=1 Tax=Sphingomonas endolithica TaxID=2972485 RepID=UPI0021AEADA5|nr:GNAT family N-acetyltransferase [Sphingomonas sp. ZFBP2030]
MPGVARIDDFHLGRGWYDPWRAAYLGRGARPLAIAGLPLLDERARLGPIAYRHRRSQTNVHSPRLDVAGAGPLDQDLPARLLADRPDMVTLEYVPEGSRLLEAARTWDPRHVTILPQAAAPVADCRGPYGDWLAARSKRARARWAKLERMLVGDMSMQFEVLDGRDRLDALLDECLAVEQSGWKGREGTAILDNAADTLFYTSLAREAAAAGVLRLAVLRHEGRIVAFEYGVTGGDRLFLLKVGYDEAFEQLSIGHVLATLNIRHCCADPDIAWYDKLGNGMTPAAYKLRFSDRIDTLYRITLFGRSWRGRLLHLYQRARHSAKLLHDRWRKPRTIAA